MQVPFVYSTEFIAESAQAVPRILFSVLCSLFSVGFPGKTVFAFLHLPRWPCNCLANLSAVECRLLIRWTKFRTGISPDLADNPGWGICWLAERVGDEKLAEKSLLVAEADTDADANARVGLLNFQIKTENRKTKTEN